FVEDEVLRALYALCDGVIAPSLAEGGAYVGLEGVLFRRPVAVSGIDSARLHLEMAGVVSGDQGEVGAVGVRLFDPFDVEAMADAMEALLDDGAAMVGRNESARERIAGWSFERVARRYREAMLWALGLEAMPELLDSSDAVVGALGGRVGEPIVQTREHAERLGVTGE
ncbi:MAG: hypothetical protein AAGK04_14825, partial [Planctomycetota bacterium]